MRKAEVSLLFVKLEGGEGMGEAGVRWELCVLQQKPRTIFLLNPN